MLEAVTLGIGFVFQLLLIPTLFYLIYCLHYYIIQPHLVYKPDYDLNVHSKTHTIEHEEITFRTEDGIHISAWHVPAESPTHMLLFCHGNAGNITQRIDSLLIFKELGLSSFIFDYRGYGKSEGKPTEKGTYLDVESAWNYLINRMKLKPENIIVFGRSLGGAVAAYIAQQKQPRALILESTFSSAHDLAHLLFPWAPIPLLTRYEYDTKTRIKDVKCPVLVIHSPIDEVIPFEQGQTLFNNANPPKKFLEIDGNHLWGFYYNQNIYKKGLNDFLKDYVL